MKAPVEASCQITKTNSSSPRFVLSVQTNPPEMEEKKNDTVHVLVIAHPDDESMFFLPTLSALRDAGETVWILCLTTGNYDGLGETRQGELSSVCRLLRMDRLIQLDVEALRDHPTQSWSLDAVTTEIERALAAAIRRCSYDIQRLKLITFDVDGVSGHINHRDTHWGVRNLIYKHQGNGEKTEDSVPTGKNNNSPNSSLPPMEAWQLETVHFLPIKYLPILEWLRLLCYCCWLWKPKYAPLPSTKSNSTHVYRSMDCFQSWRAMATHHSQWVWYRRLFVIFSCYTFVNKLRPVQ
jgi:N-acetylglucosaminylphosphatidylinositol deacetylase